MYKLAAFKTSCMYEYLLVFGLIVPYTLHETACIAKAKATVDRCSDGDGHQVGGTAQVVTGAQLD